jgi:hypothetical protein
MSTIQLIEVYCQWHEEDRHMAYFSTQQLADDWIETLKAKTGADCNIYSRVSTITVDEPRTESWVSFITRAMEANL